MKKSSSNQETELKAIVEEQFRSAMQFSSIGTALVSIEGNWLMVNPAICKILGYSEKELLVTNFQSITYKDDLAKDMGQVERLLNRDISAYMMEKRYIHKNGSLIWAQLNVSLVLDSTEKPLYFIAQIQDISERKKIEIELQKTLGRLALATQSAHIGIWDYDVAENHLLWDEAMYDLYGIAPHDFTSAYEAWSSTLHPDDRVKTETLLSDALQGIRDYNCEFRILLPDGSTRYIRAAANVVRDGTGKAMRMQGVNWDITSQKKMQEDLEVARDQSEEANRAKSEFLAMMSHEIRTPMNGIIGFTNLLDNENLGKTERKKYLDIIKTCGENLLTLINDILDLSKWEAKKLDLETEEFDLHEAVGYVTDLLMTKAYEKKVEIALFIHPHIPKVYCGDRKRIEQVLTNLVGNAVKFTDQGSVGVFLDIDQGEKQETIKFRVKDTGCGIASKKIKDLFKPFSQVDSSSTRKFEGTGLGLVISKRIMEAMGGDIGCQSEEGKGSEFWFTIPFQNALLDILPSIESEVDMKLLEEKRILVVDDTEANRKVLKLQFSSWNMDCEAVSSAQEAMAALKKSIQERKPFSVGIIDYYMPQMNGVQLVQEIRKNSEYNEIILLMLGSVDCLNGKKPQELGLNGIITKPVVKQSYLLSELFTALHLSVKEDEKTEAVSPPPPALLSSSPKRRMLIVEDNFVNYRLISLLLASHNSELVWVKNGNEAVEKIQQEAYDLVLMDCLMPVMDGYQATEIIRQLEQNKQISPPYGQDRLPIIAVTAHAFDANRIKCLNSGMDDVLTKPVDPEELNNILQKWICKKL